MSDNTRVREELIQTAAVCVAIVQDLDSGVADVNSSHLVSILADVSRERRRQDEKFGPQHHTIPEWLMILGEEYGEACQAAVDSHGFATTPKTQQCAYCKEWFPFPVQLHHSDEECTGDRS